MVPEAATVVRGGLPVVVPAREVVRGDVVVLSRGDRVPADAPVARGAGAGGRRVGVTGGSLAVAKSSGAVAAGAPVADRTCVVYGGTLVTGGRGRTVVFATGRETELGRITEMVRGATPVQMPLTRALSRFAWLIARAIAGIAGVVLTVALARGYAVSDAALATISLAVATIPEGLPAIVTIALAVGVRHMARRQAVVRRLPAVETLGSTAVIYRQDRHPYPERDGRRRAVGTQRKLARRATAGGCPVQRRRR